MESMKSPYGNVTVMQNQNAKVVYTRLTYDKLIKESVRNHVPAAKAVDLIKTTAIQNVELSTRAEITSTSTSELVFDELMKKSVPIETQRLDRDGNCLLLRSMDVLQNDQGFINLNMQRENFFDAMLNTEDGSPSFLPAFSHYNDEDMFTDRTVSHFDARSSLCSDSDHMSFNSISGSYKNDDALTNLEIKYETSDTGCEENIHGDNKNTNDEENYHINNHCLEAKSTIIQQPKLFKTTPCLVVISPSIQSKGPIDVCSYEQLLKSFVSTEPVYQYHDLSIDEIKLIEERGIKLPSQFPITKQEVKEVKLIRRKIKNTLLARVSRKRKLEYTNKLEALANKYSEENINLQTTNHQLRVEIECLRNSCALWLNKNNMVL